MISTRERGHQRLISIGGSRKGLPWTPAEDVIALREDITVTEMAYMLDRPYKAVCRRRERLRRTPNRVYVRTVQKPWTPLEDFVIRLDLPINELAEALGRTPSAITARRRRLDVNPRPAMLRRQSPAVGRRGSTRDTLARDRRIMQLRSEGLSMRQIGKAVGVSAPGVCKAIQRNSAMKVAA